MLEQLQQKISKEADKAQDCAAERPVNKSTSQNRWPRINSLIKTTRSAVLKNRTLRGFYFAASAAKF